MANRLLESGAIRRLETGGIRLLETGAPAPEPTPENAGGGGAIVFPVVPRYRAYARLRARKPTHRGRATITLILTARAELRPAAARQRLAARAAFVHQVTGALAALPIRLRAHAYATRGRAERELELLTRLLD